MIKISKVYNKYYIIQYFRTFLNISQCHHFAKIPQIFQNGNNLQCEIFISHSSKTLRYNTRMKLFYRKASGPISDKVVISLPGFPISIKCGVSKICICIKTLYFDYMYLYYISDHWNTSLLGLMEKQSILNVSKL